MPNFISPIRNPEPVLTWDKFGAVRPLNIDPSGKPHRGVDLRDSKKDNTVIASESGTVVISEPRQGSYIDIDHGGGWRTRYVHLLQRNFGVGTKVKKGEVIGKFGKVGISTGSHLHFEIMQNNLPVDPQLYIDFSQKTTIINQTMPKTPQNPPIQEVLGSVLHGAKTASKKYVELDWAAFDRDANAGKAFDIGHQLLALTGDRYKRKIRALEAELATHKTAKASSVELSTPAGDVTNSDSIPSVTTSTDKPFWRSKKFLALASLIPLIPTFLAILPEPYSSYASGAYMIVTALYLLIQGQIDRVEAQNRFKIAMEKLKK